MKHLLLFLAVMLLVACNTPSPQFRGIPATRITVDGSVFDVRIRENRAEAMRVNAQYAPRFGSIEQRASIAIEQVSGCTVSRVTGDQALIFGRLKCGKGRRPPASGPIELDCVPVRGSGIKEIGQIRIDIECDIS